MATLDEDVLYRVRSTTVAKDLGAAISAAVYDGKRITLRSIGAGATQQAVKAVAIARQLVAARGIDLFMIPGFQDVQMPDRMTTAIILRVRAS